MKDSMIKNSRRTSFYFELEKLRNLKNLVYSKMKRESLDPEIQAYYSNPKNII